MSLYSGYKRILLILVIIMAITPILAKEAFASGTPSQMPPFVAPASGTYFNSTTAVQLQWQIPTDAEQDTVELKVVFFKSDSQPASIPSTTAGASSEVALFKPMFSLPTPIDTNPAGTTPPGTAMSFQVLEGFNAITLTEGKWWWDVYAWDGSSYSSPQRQPRSFILDFTKPTITNMVLSNPTFSPTSPTASKQSTTLSYTLSETSLVTIEVLNSSSAVIKTLESDSSHVVPPSAQNVTWDGSGSTGDGTYTIRVRAKDLAGNQSDDASIAVVINSTLPAISFGSPALSNNPFSPLPASPTVKDSTDINYIINDTSDVKIVVYPQGTPAAITKTLMPKTNKNSGTYLITWDGTDDATGISVNDGIYTISITSTNAIGFETSITHNVTIDKTVTAIAPFSASPSPFSPTISPSNITFSLSEDATVEIIIKDQARAVIKRNLQTPTPMLQRIAPQIYTIPWDGRDSGGNIVDDAIYAFEIITEDLAGNKNTNVGNVKVDKSGPIIAPYSVSPLAISPGISPGITDAATISYTISKAGTVEILVISKTGPQVRQFGPYYQTLGTHSETWDGNDMSGNIVGEGDYKIEIYLTDAAGNLGSPNPATLSVAVDNTPPAIIGITATPQFFSPKNSNSSYTATLLKYTLSESAEVSIRVLDSSNNQIRTLLTSIPQSSGLKSISWDGKDDSAAYVADGTYTFEITATDPALNSTTAVKTVEVDNSGPTVNILSATPTPFAPDSQNAAYKTTIIKYILADARAQCTAEVNVKTRIGAIVKNLGSGLLIPTGTLQNISWDGKNTLGQIVEDGTYGVHITAVDQAGNPSADTSIEVYIQNRGPSITSVKFRDNRDTIDTNDSIEITFDTPIDDSAFTVGGLPVDVNSVFQIVGSGTFGTGATIDTGAAPNDNIIEIKLGNGYVKLLENGDTLNMLPSSNYVRSYPTQVISKDNIAHLVLDGSPPYLLSSTYYDVGNDGLNKGDTIIMTFNEGVSAAKNSPSAVKLLPAGRGYTIGGGASLSTGNANQIVITLGDVSTTSIIIRGIFDPTGANPIPTGINVVTNQTAIVDNAGNPATPNLNIVTPAIPGVDIGSNDSTGPKTSYAKYYDKNTAAGKGGLSDGDIIYVGFDKAIMVSPDPNFSPGTVFKLPVANDAFGAGASFTYSGVKEVAITLGTNPMLTVKGVYSLGNDIASRPSGIDINFITAANPEISDLAGNPALTNIPVDIGSIDATAPKVLVGKLTSQLSGDIVDNQINPTTGTFTIIVVVDDNTLKDGDVKIDLSSVLEGSGEVNLERDGTTTTFKKIVTFPTNPYITGAKTFTVKATDFSGNVSQLYVFTAYVVEPAALVTGEINPSSVPKRAGANSEAEEFTLTMLPTITTYNKGIDKISIKHPGGGYSYTQDTIDIYVGERKLLQNLNYTYSKNSVGANFDITLYSDGKLNQSVSGQKFIVKFKMNVPMTANSPTGSTFEVSVTESSFLAPYQQSVINGNADGDASNNNKLNVVVSDVGIEDVQTKLDYSEFFWRINFTVRFNKELSTATSPKCFYLPENITPAVSEIPIQFVKFENKQDTDATGKPIKSYYTGYARVPIDNVNYLSSFTFIAKGFYDTDGVLIAKVYKKNVTMSPGFIVTAFTNPIDSRDLLITILSTTSVTNQFQLGIRQPGKNPIYRAKNELITHRQNLFTYKYRIDENYSSQIDMAVLDPGESFPAASSAQSPKSKSMAGSGNSTNQKKIYSIKLYKTDFSSDVNFVSADGLAGIIKSKEQTNSENTLIIAPQYFESKSADGLVKLSAAYQFAPEDISFKNPAILKFKIHPEAEEYLKYKNSNISNISEEKIAIYKQNNGKWDFVSNCAADKDGAYLAYADSLGTYALFADMEKPEVKIINSDGETIKNNIEISIKDNGSGFNESGVKVVCGEKTYNVKPAKIEKYDSETRILLNPESFKNAGISFNKDNLINFEISDNCGNVTKSAGINYQVAPNTSLYQSIIAYPNPAKSYSNIQYLLSQSASEVSLKIYDSAINLVFTSYDNPVNASNTAHVIRWNLINDDGERVANGVYHYKLKARLSNGETVEKTGKIAVLK